MRIKDSIFLWKYDMYIKAIKFETLSETLKKGAVGEKLDIV